MALTHVVKVFNKIKKKTSLGLGIKLLSNTAFSSIEIWISSYRVNIDSKIQFHHKHNVRFIPLCVSVPVFVLFQAF